MSAHELVAARDKKNRVGIWRHGLDVVAVFALAFAVRIANFRHEPLTDELYHLLAASSWLSSGEFLIADGEYLRGRIFTMLVAMVLAVTGESLDAVRVFCVLLGAFLVVSVFVGVRAVAGRSAAWAAAIMLALMPGAIFLSQYIRFYSLHALVFWIAALMLYVVTQSNLSIRRKVVWLLPVAALIVLSFQLQITTAIGLVGIAVWFAVNMAPRMWNNVQRRSLREKLLIVVGLVLLILIGVSLLLGPLEFLIWAYRGAPLWSAGQYPAYYHNLYNAQFGAFWALFPVAVLAAIASNPKPSVFFLCVFSTAFILQSFGGLQAERFNFYGMPFFVAIWGIGGVTLVRWLHRQLKKSIASCGIGARRLGHPGGLSALFLILAISFAALSTPATEFTVKMIVGKPVRESGDRLKYWSKYQTTWSKATPMVKSLLDQNRVFVTSQGLHALYFVGDYDFELNATRLSDFAALDGIWRDPRTGRPVFADQRGLLSVMGCHERGVLVIHDLGWESRAIVDRASAEWIRSNLDTVAAPPEWGLKIFTWDNGGQSTPFSCEWS